MPYETHGAYPQTKCIEYYAYPTLSGVCVNIPCILFVVMQTEYYAHPTISGVCVNIPCILFVVMQTEYYAHPTISGVCVNIPCILFVVMLHEFHMQGWHSRYGRYGGTFLVPSYIWQCHTTFLWRMYPHARAHDAFYGVCLPMIGNSSNPS